MIIDYQIRLMNFPTNRAKEMVTENADGSYTIFLEASLSKEEQRDAFCHAMSHIIGKDFEQTDINKIELSAHSVNSSYLREYYT